jgi:glucose/arabinose dehydrogenase
MRTHTPVSAALLALVLLAAPACGGDDDDSQSDDGGVADARWTDAGPTPDAATPVIDAGPTADALVPTCTPTPGTNIALMEVAGGLADPLFVTAPPGDTRIFILEQPGRIRIVKDGLLLDTPFLDITDGVEYGGERGLLGLAFHPGYAENGRFFVNYTSRPAGATVVAEYRVSADADAAATPEIEIITIDQPYENHNGGMIAFGPDGYLYIGMGDGGWGGDPWGHGQDETTLLGSMLRIDINSGSPYTSPAGNPYLATPGADEIWSIGLRNPWRFSFDRGTGDLYIGDVGQGDLEEISYQAAGSGGGKNFGWAAWEGSACFNGPCDDPSIHTPPIAEYPHGGTPCSVTGGYVYRGSCLPDLVGLYFYGDYCSDDVWSFRLVGGVATEETSWSDNLNSKPTVNGLSSFGEDAYGELYVTSLNTGRVFKIVAE